jgi:flagellar biogenesis protein FliO
MVNMPDAEPPADNSGWQMTTVGGFDMNGNAILWAIFLVLGIIVMIIWLITRFT